MIEELKNDPRLFFRIVWGEDIIVWDKLEEIIDSVIHNKRTTVRSAHGVGKSWLMARLAIWFLLVHRPSKVITTAPSWHQVEKVLWGEIRTAYAQSKIPLGGRLLNTEYRLTEDTFAIGLSTSENVSGREYGATKLQGFHSPNLLFIMDEAAGVPPEIWTAATSLLTGDHNKIVAIGNPASPSGSFYNTFTSSIWNKIQISGFDHPNIKKKRVIVSGCITEDWIEERKEEWGQDDNLYKAKVLGEFPTEDADTLFPLSDIESATRRELPEVLYTHYGVDVARFGSDETVIYKRNGLTFILIGTIAKGSTTELAGQLIADYKQTPKASMIGVDDIGVGGGVTDMLREQDISVHAVNFAEKAFDNERFFNLKAEIFWNLRMEFINGTISIPNDPKLISQLTSLKYTYSSKGQKKIESKEEMKKRGLKSPDRADALAICYWSGRQKNDKIDAKKELTIAGNLYNQNF